VAAVERRAQALLIGLVLFDCVLTTWAWAFPQWWYDAFHGVKYVDPEALLRRMGAQWAGFALCQAVAVWRWRREPEWLAVVAGVRLCDALTDLTYVFLARDTTWFAWATLPAMGPINALMGWYLLRAYRVHGRR